MSAGLTFVHVPRSAPGGAGAGIVDRIVRRVVSDDALGCWAGGPDR